MDDGCNFRTSVKDCFTEYCLISFAGFFHRFWSDRSTRMESSSRRESH